MTREEQLVFCERCLNRKMDLKLGLVCNLTGERATFQGDCPDYALDESVKIASPAEKLEGLAPSEVVQTLSPEILERLKLEQRLIPGILAGIIVGFIGAIAWGALTVATNYQIGYMAVAIGAGVGFAIRKFGNGIEKIFGFWGAGIALLSVFIGNFLSIIGFIANEENLGYIETLVEFDYAYFPALMKATFRGMDLLFYGIAVYEGYHFSFRKITEEDLAG